MNLNYDYDNVLSIVPHYIQYPQMLPWVGVDYKKYNFLIVGESHYLPQKSTIHLSSIQWYDSSISGLNEDEINWSHTRNVISCGHNQYWQYKGHTIFRNLERSILDSGFNPNDKSSMFRYISYLNFFQRPAVTGLSLNYDERDVSISIDVFQQVISILRPTKIAFVSKKPWDICIYKGIVKWDNNLKKYIIPDDYLICTEYFPHPACRWWNKESLQYQLYRDGIRRNGRKKFIEFIRYENIFI